MRTPAKQGKSGQQNLDFAVGEGRSAKPVESHESKAFGAKSRFCAPKNLPLKKGRAVQFKKISIACPFTGRIKMPKNDLYKGVNALPILMFADPSRKRLGY